jgi:hypothetical protein
MNEIKVDLSHQHSTQMTRILISVVHHFMPVCQLSEGVYGLTAGDDEMINQFIYTSKPAAYQMQLKVLKVKFSYQTFKIQNVCLQLH